MDKDVVYVCVCVCVCVCDGILLSQENEIMPFVGTWIQLENIMLSDIVRQRNVNIYHMVSLICGI